MHKVSLYAQSRCSLREQNGLIAERSATIEEH